MRRDSKNNLTLPKINTFNNANNNTNNTRNFLFDNDDSKDQVIGSMTQEILNTYKSKIKFLENENKKLLEDVQATNRNFEALNSKYLENQKLLKMLQDELYKLKQKNKNDNNINLENENSKKKINELNDIISNLNLDIKKLKNKYNTEIEKIKKENENLNNKIKIEKDNTKLENENYDKLKNENSSLLNKNKELNENLSKLSEKYVKKKTEFSNIIIELKKEIDKLKDENKLLYNSLTQSRDKLNSELLKNEELKKKLKNSKEKELLDEIEKYQKIINNLKNELDIEKQSNSFNELNAKSLMEEINKLKNKNKNFIMSNQIKFSINKIKKISINKIYNFSFSLIINKKLIFNISKLFNFSLLPNLNLKKSENKNYKISNELNISFEKDLKRFNDNINEIKNLEKKFYDEQIKNLKINLEKEYQDKIEKYKNLFKNNIKIEINNFIENIFNKNLFQNIEDKISKNESKINNLNILISNKFTNIIKNSLKINENNFYLKRNFDFELKKLKNEYENKLTKKRNKKYTLKNEISELKKQIDYLNSHKIDLTVINKLVENIKEITSRLHLTYESLQKAIECKNCNKLEGKMYVLNCGHSNCINCIVQSTTMQCIECKISFKRENIKENKALNDLIVRYNYSKQQIYSDMDLMINTIQKYLVEGN